MNAARRSRAAGSAPASRRSDGRRPRGSTRCTSLSARITIRRPSDACAVRWIGRSKRATSRTWVSQAEIRSPLTISGWFETGSDVTKPVSATSMRVRWIAEVASSTRTTSPCSLSTTNRSRPSAAIETTAPSSLTTSRAGSVPRWTCTRPPTANTMSSLPSRRAATSWPSAIWTGFCPFTSSSKRPCSVIPSRTRMRLWSASRNAGKPRRLTSNVVRAPVARSSQLQPEPLGCHVSSVVSSMNRASVSRVSGTIRGSTSARSVTRISPSPVSTVRDDVRRVTRRGCVTATGTGIVVSSAALRTVSEPAWLGTTITSPAASPMRGMI